MKANPVQLEIYAEKHASDDVIYMIDMRSTEYVMHYAPFGSDNKPAIVGSIYQARVSLKGDTVVSNVNVEAEVRTKTAEVKKGMSALCEALPGLIEDAKIGSSIGE